MLLVGQKVAQRTDEKRVGTIVRVETIPGRGQFGFVKWTGEQQAAIPYRESSLIILGV